MGKGFLTRKRNVICVGGLLILLTGVWLYQLTLRDRVFEWVLSGRELVVQKKIATIRQKNLEEYEENILALAKVEAEASEMENRVTAYHQIPDSLSKVDTWLAEYRLAVISFSASGYEEIPAGVLPDVRIYRVRAEVEGTGRYEDILLFLDALDKESTHYHVDKLTLTATELEGMRFGMAFSIYAYKAGRDNQ